MTLKTLCVAAAAYLTTTLAGCATTPTTTPNPFHQEVYNTAQLMMENPDRAQFVPLEPKGRIYIKKFQDGEDTVVAYFRDRDVDGTKDPNNQIGLEDSLSFVTFPQDYSEPDQYYDESLDSLQPHSNDHVVVDGERRPLSHLGSKKLEEFRNNYLNLVKKLKETLER